MHPKKIITTVLLIFVAVSIVFLLMPDSDTTIVVSDPTVVEQGDSSPVPEDRLLVYYLHGNIRCQTCETLEVLSQKAVLSNFEDQISKGTIEWKVVNYEDSGNDHFLKDFDISFQSLVIVDVKENKQLHHENLDKIWELVHDEEAYLAYVKTKIDEHLSKVI